MKDDNLPRWLDEGRYTVDATLGTGGMATVRLCYDHTLEVWRAVKFLSPELASRKSIRERFRSEGHAMARIDHPNVVRVYDIGEVDETLFMVMEFAPGGSVEGYLEKHGKMHPALAAAVIQQVAAGVAAAHEEGIIHRDIKPDNILVGKTGVCKVTDFGIAQLRGPTSMTRTGSVMGTLAYMAPEQKKDAKHLGPAADVYAMGATLWSMLTGEVPHDLFMASTNDKMLGDIEEPLRSVVRESIRYEPEERYPTAEAFRDAVVAATRELGPVPEGLPSLVNKTILPTQVPPTRPAMPTPVRDSGSSDPTFFPDATPKPAESKQTALPYYMPAQHDRSDEVSYIDEDYEREARKRRALEELERVKAARGISVPPSAPPEPPPEAPPQETYRPAPDAEEAAQNLFSAMMTLIWGLVTAGPLRFIWVPIGALGITLTGVYIFGMMRVNAAAGEMQMAQSRLISLIESEQRVLEDIEVYGGDHILLKGAYERVFKAEGAKQIEEGIAYAAQLSKEVDAHAREAPAQHAHRAQMAIERSAKLDVAMKRAQKSLLEWEQAADSGPGRVACFTTATACP